MVVLVIVLVIDADGSITMTMTRTRTITGNENEMHSTTIDLRVRYVECDPMGFVHHTVYPIWFEMARTELLRETGVAYAELERRGVLIVVVKLEAKYRRPARYDDELKVTATVRKVGSVRIEHDYHVRRGDELICTGSTTLACLDRDGKLRAVPEELFTTQAAEGAGGKQ